jgi:hypothetical protein
MVKAYNMTGCSANIDQTDWRAAYTAKSMDYNEHRIV